MSKKMSPLYYCVAFIGLAIVAVGAIAAPDELDIYYEKDDFSLAAYDKVLLNPLLLASAKVVPPPWVEGEDRLPHKWVLSDADITRAKAAYLTAMKNQLATLGGYTIVSEPGPGVLELTVAIVNLTPYAQEGDKVITKGTGELTVQATLRDGMSRELLALYEGEQAVGQEYQENTPLTAQHNVRELFALWGARVRQMLDDDHQGD